MQDDGTSEATNTAAPAVIPDGAIAKAYERAMAHARRFAKGESELEELFIDAATDAIMWARERCDRAESFAAFAHAAVYRFVGRALLKHKERRDRRPEVSHLPEQMEGRRVTSARPTLIADLPEDLAFLVRLYMLDAYTLREIGLLTGQSPNTVDLKLKRAAALLHDGPLVAPARRNGEKRLSRG